MNISQIGEHSYSPRNIASFNKANVNIQGGNSHSRAAFGGNRAAKLTISPEAQALAERFAPGIPDERFKEILDMLSKDLNMNWRGDIGLGEGGTIYAMLDKFFKDEDFKANFIEQASLSPDELKFLDKKMEFIYKETMSYLEYRWQQEVFTEAWKNGISIGAAAKEYGMEIAKWVTENCNDFAANFTLAPNFTSIFEG
jgi:hypothetical protein